MILLKKRIAVLLLGALLLMGFLILRVTYIQVFMAGWLKKSAEDQRFRAVSINPSRGTIYDRSGNELAISIDSDSVFAIPKEIDIGKNVAHRKDKNEIAYNNELIKKAKVAKIVGNILTVDPAKLETLFSKQTSFVWIKRKAAITEIEELRKAIKNDNIQGIEISQSPRRFYPRKTLASQLLGIAGVDNQGLEGLEKHLDHYLRGVPGSDRAEFDTSGRHIPQGERRYQPPVNGDTVYLTIDQNIQFIVERELEKAVKETQSARGMGIIVNPQTGEILAIASYPSYDPNQYGNFPAANRRNPLFSDMYEPGSTFKMFTAAAALEDGKVTPESTFFDPGYLIVDDRRLKCWKAGGHGSQNFVEALENSCNPVFATLALRLTKETFYEYIKAFGFGAQSGIEFPGESAGMLKPLTIVKNVELANIGFGQGITVTPLQMVMGASAIANGGFLLKPQLIKEIQAPDGKPKRVFQRQIVRQVISGKTSALMRQLMESVVTNGSGNKAYIPGYRIAGKTGTAQKVVEGRKGYSNKVIASFIGYAPADNPQLLTMVLLDEPNSPITYGGVIAAPVVGNIFRDALRYLGVRPQFDPQMLEEMNKEKVIVPNVLNLPVAEAVKAIKRAGLDYRLLGEGTFIYEQVPRNGTSIAKGSKVILYLDQDAKYSKTNTKILLPDLHGLSVEKCHQILSELGLKMETTGKGNLVNQHPAAGKMVDYGSIIKATFNESY